MIPTKPRMQQQLQRMPGIQCPICSQLIPVSIHQLLFARSLHCPVCGLSLFIDKKKKILAKVDEAQRRVEDTSHFSK